MKINSISVFHAGGNRGWIFFPSQLSNPRKLIDYKTQKTSLPKHKKTYQWEILTILSFSFQIFVPL